MTLASNTPRAGRLHIGIFGKRNAGKSSVINAITGQDLAVVSKTKGTTTDPVSKAMEILPIGPVLLTDTAGIDDKGELGDLRVKKSFGVLNKAHIALYVVDGALGLDETDIAFIEKIKEKELPLIIVYNKVDLEFDKKDLKDEEILISSKTGENVNRLKELIIKMCADVKTPTPIVSDLINKGDSVILVIPIDESAPKGRIILPQQQTLRDILDSDATAYVTKEDKVKDVINNLKTLPALVITDSKVFKEVSSEVPENIPLTSFSILFARHKGILKDTIKGVSTLDKLENGDTVLITEGCTHHRQCDDIGTVRIPKMIKSHTGKNINFEFASGSDFPENLSKYSLVVHCGGCMLNDKEVKHRLKIAKQKNVPMTNYGLLIAHVTGILKRSISIFDDVRDIL